MFRTELPLTPHPQQLPLSARVLTIGSCFSDSIGSRLADFKVATMANPFGTVFNPISACKLLRAAAGEDMDWQQHLVEARGRWQSYDLHAQVGASSPVELLQHIQALTRETGVFLATADLVVLTLGTAYAYRLRETDEIVNNCHKVPAEKFEKELLTADEIIAAVAETHAYLRRINPRLRFVLTVSPVRHVKETLVLNSASKAMLRVACHYLSELLPDVSYFPAYELLVDDLRDYRFYASDMLHPSEVAENYIWERFTRTFFDTAFGRFKKEWEGIRQALGHRPLYAASPEHRQFLESTLERLHKVSGLADVRMETLHLERELAGLPLPPAPMVPEEEEYDDDEERIDVGVSSAVEVSVSSRQEASLDGAGAGILLETDNEDEDEDAIEVSSEVAYEHAYTAASADEEEVETDAATDFDEVSVEGEEPVRKKKRRSRGGAKRTKRKHARLAAELGAEAAQNQPVTASMPAAVSDSGTQPDQIQDEVEETTPADEVIYITEDELRRGRRAPAEVAPSIQPTTDEQEPAAEEEAPAPEMPANNQPRRERNNRRAPRPARSGGRTERPALYASAPTEDQAVELPLAPAASVTPDVVEASTPFEAEAPVLETAPVAAAPEPISPSTRSRKRPPAKPRAPRATPVEAPDAITPPEAVSVTTPSPAAPVLATPEAVTATPEAAPKPAKAPARSRKRPAAKPPVTPEAAPSPAAEAPPVAAKPARKRPPRRPKAATEALAPAPAITEAPVPAEAAPTGAAPKRKPRPPRRKPGADTPAPETT
ncbi:GSCFA domain-containing protein [Hymenobacter tenuis]